MLSWFVLPLPAGSGSTNHSSAYRIVVNSYSKACNLLYIVYCTVELNDINISLKIFVCFLHLFMLSSAQPLEDYQWPLHVTRRWADVCGIVLKLSNIIFIGHFFPKLSSIAFREGNILLYCMASVHVVNLTCYGCFIEDNIYIYMLYIDANIHV